MNLICSIPNCGHLAEKNGICGRHNREARKSAAPKEKPKRQRIAKQSDEGKERTAVYKAIKELWIVAHPLCEVHDKIFPEEWLNEPTPKTSEPHHQRGKIGDLLYDVRYWLPVCRRCHQYIELHPEESYVRGYSLSRHAIETV